MLCMMCCRRYNIYKSLFPTANAMQSLLDVGHDYHNCANDILFNSVKCVCTIIKLKLYAYPSPVFIGSDALKEEAE